MDADFLFDVCKKQVRASEQGDHKNDPFDKSARLDTINSRLESALIKNLYASESDTLTESEKTILYKKDLMAISKEDETRRREVCGGCSISKSSKSLDFVCNECNSAFYCSKKCMKKSIRTHQRAECGYYKRKNERK